MICKIVNHFFIWKYFFQKSYWHRKCDFFKIGTNRKGDEWNGKNEEKQQNEKLYCPYCGGLAVLRPAEYVYGERNLNPDNYLYVCSGYPSCDSYIGVHKKSMRPMGTLANGDLRHKRIEAHRALNKVVQAGIMTKHGAYIWLQNRLCLREKDMHIGMFSEYRCEETSPGV